jgi:hypothetical protein
MCTTYLNILKLYILSTQCICVLLMILTINSINRLRTSCVEAGLDTSTVALRVVGGDEKGTQCLGL